MRVLPLGFYKEREREGRRERPGKQIERRKGERYMKINPLKLKE